jgi:hypothetical protein
MPFNFGLRARLASLVVFHRVSVVRVLVAAETARRFKVTTGCRTSKSVISGSGGFTYWGLDASVNHKQNEQEIAGSPAR